MDDADVEVRQVLAEQGEQLVDQRLEARGDLAGLQLVVDGEQGRVLRVQRRQQRHGDPAVEATAPAGEHADGVAVLQQQLGVLAHQQLDAADDRRAGEMEDADGPRAVVRVTGS